MTMFEEIKKVLNKKIYRNDVYNHARWCVVSNTEYGYSKFWDIVNEKLPSGYCLLESEAENFKKIINEFSYDVLKLISNNHLAVTKEFAKLSDELYFFVMLNGFCCDNEGKIYFNEGGIPLYTYNSEVNSYTTLYNLTDFGITFTKIHLAAAIVENKINPKFKYEYLKKTLDTGTTERIRYIP